MAPPKGFKHPAEAIEKIRASSIERGAIPPSSLGRPGPWKGKRLPPEVIAKIAAKMLGRPSPNKGKRGAWKQSAESNAKRSASHSGRPKSIEARLKMSVAKAGKPGRPQAAQARLKVSAARSGKPLSLEHRSKLSAAKMGKDRRYNGRRFMYAGTAFRSSWEALAAMNFDKLNIKWEWEPERFRLSTTQTYCPDFFLPESGCYWEVKGYFDPKSKRKVALFRELYPEFPLVVATAEVLELLDPSFDRTKAPILAG